MGQDREASDGPAYVLYHLAPFRITPTGNRVGPAPIDIVFAYRDETVKRRPFPVPDPCHEVVFARVPVKIIHAAFQVILVADGVLPVSLVPNAPLAVLAA